MSSPATAAAFLSAVVIFSVFMSAPATADADDGRRMELTELSRLRPVNRLCGRSKYPNAGDMELPAPKVVGGMDARPHEFPWQVSIRYLGIHFCGGSIVSPSWILTAAHCFEWLTVADAVKKVTVTVGEHSRNATSPVRQVLLLRSVIKGDYDSETRTGDIALVKVRGKIRYSTNVAPVCLPASGSSFDFQKCVVSGWGAIEWGGRSVQTLQYASLNVTSKAFCNSMFNGTIHTIYDDMSCATDNEGDFTRDTCQGDSGGPLALKGAGGRFTVAGITSWGIGCASGYPGVYTRVSSYVDFICRTTGIRCIAN